MDKIKDNTSELYNIDYIKNKIKVLINDFMLENNINNMQDTSENVFNAFLMDAGKATFINDFFVIDKKYHIYNYVLIDYISELYIYLCMLYDKNVSVSGFAYLLNINSAILNTWKNNNNNIDINLLNDFINQLHNIYNNNIDTYFNIMNNIYTNNNNTIINSIINNLCCDADVVGYITAYRAYIIQKLHNTREHTISNKLLTLKHPTGLLSVVNKEYSWNVQQIQKETTARVLALQELPKIETLL